MLFNKRKPIIIGETYIFDALNESNLASSTSAVTVIKKSDKKHHWIVMSVNNGDVFECPETLLTELVKYDTINPIIRCQYGTTDFCSADLAFVDMLIKAVEILNEQVGDDNIAKFVKEYSDEFRDKVAKYVDISNYKIKLSIIKTITNIIENEHSKDSSLCEKLVKEEVQTPNSFYDSFNNLVAQYANGELTMDEFVETGLNILEDELPNEYYIPKMVANQEVTFAEITSLVENTRKAVNTNHIVFLSGIDSESDHLAIAVWSEEDIEQVYYFIDHVYDKWDDKWEGNSSYNSKYRIVMISVERPDRTIFGDDNYDD